MEDTVKMKTKAVRLYGQSDLRLEEFELPAIREDEILAHIITDSICMSLRKEAISKSRPLPRPPPKDMLSGLYNSPCAP